MALQTFYDGGENSLWNAVLDPPRRRRVRLEIAFQPIGYVRILARPSRGFWQVQDSRMALGVRRQAHDVKRGVRRPQAGAPLGG